MKEILVNDNGETIELIEITGEPLEYGQLTVTHFFGPKQKFSRFNPGLLASG